MATKKQIPHEDFEELLESPNVEDALEFVARSMHPLYGFSLPSIILHESIADAANSSKHVLITGETGTGKELVASEIARIAGKHYHPISCADINPLIVESELFGHRKGAFTGATDDKKGLFEDANGGILFLDEIGEMPRWLQGKLLRVAESQFIKRVGDTEPRKVDVRILAATNHWDELRPELRWRFPIEIYTHSLSRFPENALAILHGFLKDELPAVKAEWVINHLILMTMLVDPWPGNVRQLRIMASDSIDRWQRSGCKGSRIPFHFTYGYTDPPDMAELYAAWQAISAIVRSRAEGKRLIRNDCFRIAFADLATDWWHTDTRESAYSCTLSLVEWLRVFALLGRLRIDKEGRAQISAMHSICEGVKLVTDICQSFAKGNSRTQTILRRSVDHSAPNKGEQQESVRNDPRIEIDLTHYSESDLMHAYYSQIMQKARGQRDIAMKYTGLKKDALASRLDKYKIQYPAPKRTRKNAKKR